MRCATHPSVETDLACGKCGKAICPRCLVHTPVGARCRDCAQLRKLPQYQISPSFLLRATGAAVGVGVVVGGLWGVLIPFGTSFFFGLLVGLGIGYAVGEAVSWASNRKVGTQLQVVAGLGVVVAYLVRAAVLASELKHVAVSDVVTQDTLGYVVVILAVVVAAGRVR